MALAEQEQITGVILAGGRGRRMGGVDKGLLSLGGERLVDRVLAALVPQVGKVLINANRNTEQYAALGYAVIRDELSDYQGPLAGFASAMSAVNSDYILTLPCDAPRVVDDYAQRLMQGLLEQEAAIAVAHDGQRLQPVHALIRVELLDDLRSFLASGERKIDIWYDRHITARVDFSDVPGMFDNINTPEQRERIEQEIEHGV